MTTYYIFLPGDSIKYSENSANKLGEASFNTFWKDEGFNALMKIIQVGSQELVDNVTIMTDKKKKLTVIEFLDVIEKYHVR